MLPKNIQAYTVIVEDGSVCGPSLFWAAGALPLENASHVVLISMDTAESLLISQPSTFLPSFFCFYSSKNPAGLSAARMVIAMTCFGPIPSLYLLGWPVVPLAVQAYTTFETRCTHPLEQVNFVSSHDSRGKVDILRGCLFTVFTCT